MRYFSKIIFLELWFYNPITLYAVNTRWVMIIQLFHLQDLSSSLLAVCRIILMILFQTLDIRCLVVYNITFLLLVFFTFNLLCMLLYVQWNLVDLAVIDFSSKAFPAVFFCLSSFPLFNLDFIGVPWCGWTNCHCASREWCVEIQYTS